MTEVGAIFQRLEKLIKTDSNNEFMTSVFKHITSIDKKGNGRNDCYELLSTFLKNIIQEIDTLATEIEKNYGVLISVKHQKVLRTCYQIISSFGIASCLIPGLGISFSKRCAAAQSLPPILLSDEQKYKILVLCTDFLHRSYNVPVLKNIIVTFHLIDYLAALIQLAFAPLKKPGAYPDFTMTQEMYDTLNTDRQKYVQVYEYLVSNCFQPTLMKELLVLQNVADQKSPLFVKRVIAKEMSRRLTVSGGLLSLIRCFIDGQDMDTGLEWKKVEMICKIVSTKHGNQNESDYLVNITAQLKQIFTINNTKYLATAVSCLMTLYERYNNAEQVKDLVNDILRSLNYDILLEKSHLPGTIILTPQEIEHSIQILYVCTYITQVHIPPEFVTSNLHLLFLLRIKCTNNEMKVKISSIISKALELVDKTKMCDLIKELLFGQTKSKEADVLIEEYEAGLTVKYVNSHVDYPVDDSLVNFVEFFNAAENSALISNLFEACLQIFVNVNSMRLVNNTETLLSLDDEPVLLSSNDEKYARMLTILSEISTSQKVVKILQENPLIVINFVEAILLKSIDSTNDECKTIALVLLNIILSNTDNMRNLKDKLHTFLPKFEMMASNDTEYIKILCKESMSLILSEYPKAKDSPFEKALSNISDNLLPLRAHGIMELGKLIEKADPETISKRHYVFCLLQEQLKDPDSYIYLSAINCIASLASHCTSDILGVLCKEYLDISTEPESKENRNRAAELRVKIGDVIVKVTKRLGEMAVLHKSILLNTILCACRDDDPLIRTSALSNLAEIALVLNYKMGSIIYEVLLCIWTIIETDKAIECRRAAVMVISSLIKGLGKETLIELKENLLPIYRTLNKLYKYSNEDNVVRLHAQLALEELNDIVKQFLFSELPIEKEFSMLTEPSVIIFK
ncbi:transport and Golgi organization protein 6 homolog [Maniola hyperantus]|uniref:transport and Golgi organization protein 6 homolog n=1 Tax=Aphantopus hyperantus TaxID=2795564 RepID=UPI00156A4C0A|nr:transport and Golgi organization protein 6 [Maniola hyperantus]